MTRCRRPPPHPPRPAIGSQHALRRTTCRSVVVGMYRETNRMKPSSEHPSGEDFVKRKADELAWLFAGLPVPSTYHLHFVDDGCPDGSGDAAKARIAELGLESLASVHYLQQGIDDRSPVLRGVASTRDSVKGGGIVYGLYQAANGAQAPPSSDALHILLYTDADTSTSLGQCGLLCHAICAGNVAAVGSRYNPERSVYVEARAGARGFSDDKRMSLCFRDVWRRAILPPLASFEDTQCGFKAFRAGELLPVLPLMQDRKASFDTELLLLAASRGSAASVPIAWVESLEESNFAKGNGPIGHAEYNKYFFDQMKGMLATARRLPQLLQHTPTQLEVVQLGTEMTFEQWSPLYLGLKHTLYPAVSDLKFGRDFTAAQLRQASIDGGAALGADAVPAPHAPRATLVAAASEQASSEVAAAVAPVAAPPGFFAGLLVGAATTAAVSVVLMAVMRRASSAA